MPHKNVEMIERLIEAFDRHDVLALEALSHDDLEFVSILTALDAEDATYRGPKAWTNYFKAIDEMWSEWRSEEVWQLRSYPNPPDALDAIGLSQWPSGRSG